MKRSQPVEHVISDHAPVETDLAFWLEHVVHWHALLIAVVMVLSLAYLFSNGHIVYAG